MYEKQSSIADKAIWKDVRERWRRGETVLQIAKSYRNEKEGSIFQINKILLVELERAKRPKRKRRKKTGPI